MGLLTDTLVDDDPEVARVQRVAAAGARVGASLGSPAGPVGAGLGAGFGGATGYALGVGLVGVDPAEQVSRGDATTAGEKRERSHDHDDGDDGPVVVPVDPEDGS